MDAKTRKVLIAFCLIGFLLTSTITWGVISAGIDVAQAGIVEGRDYASWTVSWILAHASLFVPVFFIGGVIWLLRQKTKTEN